MTATPFDIFMSIIILTIVTALICANVPYDVKTKSKKEIDKKDTPK